MVSVARLVRIEFERGIFMKYRFRAIAAFMLLIGGAVLGVLSVVLDWSTVLRFVAWTLVVVGTILQVCAVLCPYCDRIGLRGFFWQKEWKCKKCQRIVAFK